MFVFFAAPQSWRLGKELGASGLFGTIIYLREAENATGHQQEELSTEPDLAGYLTSGGQT